VDVLVVVVVMVAEEEEVVVRLRHRAPWDGF